MIPENLVRIRVVIFFILFALLMGLFLWGLVLEQVGSRTFEANIPQGLFAMTMIVRIIAAFIVTVIFVWGFFAFAGRWNWIAGWAYLGILVAGAVLNDMALWIKNPDLLQRRGRIGKGTKGWDKVCLTLFGLSFLLILIIGALDAGRFGWSITPSWLFAIGAALFVWGQIVVTRSMLVNPFFEKSARIQTELDHRVIDSGPYRYVRHPGYIGTIMGFILGTPLMLGSCWAFVPAGLSVLSLIVRTALEDRMLLAELDGYKAYARRVRYKLVPLLW